MKLELVYPSEQESTVREQLQELQVVPVETTKTDEECKVVVLVDPSLYRGLDEIAKNSNGRLEILKQVVRQEGDVNLELELERKKKQSVVDESERLAAQAEQSLRIGDDDDDKDEVEHTGTNETTNVDDDGEELQSQSMRHNQKKAQKKSKKAKRREKEEAAERQARIDAEKKRQEERGTSTVEQTVDGEEVQGQTKSCNTCGGSFPTANAYRAHFRSDWHRYNMKLKMKGIAPVSEQEFLLCDSDAFFDDM